MLFNQMDCHSVCVLSSCQKVFPLNGLLFSRYRAGGLTILYGTVPYRVLFLIQWEEIDRFRIFYTSFDLGLLFGRFAEGSRTWFGCWT